MESGAQSVMICGDSMMPELYADNWAIQHMVSLLVVSYCTRHREE